MQCINDFRSDAYDLKPKIIKHNQFYELWHKLDRSFFVAKSNLFIRFIFDQDVNEVAYATKLRLLIYALHHQMRNFFFDESLRQNTFQMNASANGFSAKIFSFTETLKKTSVNFIKNIQKLKLTEREFNLVKDEMKNQIKAQMNLVPQLRAYVNFFQIILKDYIQHQTILDELERLTLADFHKFYSSLFKKVYFKVFIHGSATKSQSIEIVDRIFETITSGSHSSPSKPTAIKSTASIKNYRNLHADISGYFIFREQLQKSYNINHAVLNFYQIGKENIKNIIAANLVKSLCGYIYFTQLRIKEQLGYTARAKIFSEGNVIYYMIVVQGSKKTPEFMDLRIENVINLMRKRIEAASDEKFQKFKKIIAMKIGRRDGSLKQRTFRLWNEIITGRKYFNIRDIARDYAKELTKKDILNFFDTMVTTKLRKLSVQEFSQKAKSLPTVTPTIRGYKSVLIKHHDDLRKRNKFFKLK